MFPTNQCQRMLPMTMPSMPNMDAKLTHSMVPLSPSGLTHEAQAETSRQKDPTSCMPRGSSIVGAGSRRP
jgi:hypothetical protein